MSPSTTSTSRPLNKSTTTLRNPKPKSLIFIDKSKIYKYKIPAYISKKSLNPKVYRFNTSNYFILTNL